MELYDSEVIEFIEKFQNWHEGKISQLRQIVDNDDAQILVGEKKIEPKSDLAKGLRFGVSLAIDMLGKLPFSIEKAGDKDEEEDGGKLKRKTTCPHCGEIGIPGWPHPCFDGNEELYPESE